MNQEQKVTSLGEFLVCQAEQCHQPNSIYHKSSFRDYHFDSNNNKKSTHKSVPFNQSIQFLNFQALNRLYDLLNTKVKTALRGLNTDSDSVVQTSLYKSQKFRQFFTGSQQAMSEYFYLNHIQRGIPMAKAYCFSEDFCNSMSISNDKALNKLYKQLTANSPEWQYLNYQFNYASGINSSYLQAFIQQQTTYFIDYCAKLTNEKRDFNITEYLNLRGSNKEYVNDAYYYSPEFVTFLEEKYGKNPGEEELFTLKEYYLHFWQYFFVLVDNSKNVRNYFQEEIAFYQEYEKFMAEQNLKESFLAYRMWRINRKVSNFLPSLRNPFFLETFIYSFIEGLIEKKLYYPEKQREYNFRTFLAFLHDYVFYLNDKNEEFSFSRYREYFDFRKIGEKFEETLKKNAEIVYDKKFYLQYAHNEFAEDNKLAVKKYRKYQERRRQQQDEKDQLFREKTSQLKKKLMDEEGTHFYELVWNSFINRFGEKNNRHELTVESFKEFKKSMLESVDQQYIQQKQAEYRHALDQGEQGETRTRRKQEKKQTTEDINADEEELAGQINEEDRSDASESEEERELVEDCPCCKGRPYECQEPECRVLGMCSACMLGD